ncbi:hypothetical protein CWATWH0003_2739 [Crocosphaera watsonii WH 0003]|uniref:Glycosyltransferase n=1 Tax=Crocosphaera watsonii WH 0003 TaxID=423471 RepID=G5J5H9_CROWT|nr:hypothetical protein CWATWH0003_2739 [Crocosphaera watsonii WH 0003]
MISLEKNGLSIEKSLLLCFLGSKDTGKTMKQWIKRQVPPDLLPKVQTVIGSSKKLIFKTVQKVVHPSPKNTIDKVYIAIPSSAKQQAEEIKHRCGFYIPHLPVETVIMKDPKTLPSRLAFAHEPVLVIGEEQLQPSWIYSYRKGVFNLDYLLNPDEGYVWHQLINLVSDTIDNDITESKKRFVKRVKSLQQESLDKCYVFGTGPSLEKAINRDWSDGYRVVCNTIVRDQELWNHINPHFIVAGDTIYHFGFTQFAKAFRQDLAKRLDESQAMFIYPAVFHNLVKREFKDFSDRLIPIPINSHNKRIHTDLTGHFYLPDLGNILPLVLLPVACTMSKKVGLFGFDGRAPDDKLFWRNSNKHTYLEYMPDLQKAHPSFFNHHLSKSDKNKYVKSVHGDILDEKLIDAERDGWQFIMLHKSWTPTFQKRYISK